MRVVLVWLALASLAFGEHFQARITYYTDTRTASGSKPVQGVTVAASKKYKFGTKFYIPELVPLVGGTGEFVCKDRGPAVERKAASGGKLPVIDVYVSSRAQVAKLAKLKKNTFKVEIR